MTLAAGPLRLAGGVVHPPVHGALFGVMAVPAQDSRIHRLLQDEQPDNAEWRHWLVRSSGRSLSRAVLHADAAPQLISAGENSAYVIRCTDGVAARLAAQLNGSGWLAPVVPQLKLSPELARERSRRDASTSTLSVRLFDHVEEMLPVRRARLWMGRLTAAGLPATIIPEGRRGFRVQQLQPNSSEMVQLWLARQADTFWVAPTPVFRHFNSVAKRFLRWGAAGDSIGLGQIPWALNGTGQVVAVGDTGLSYTSCYFSDPAHGSPSFIEISNGVMKPPNPASVNQQHRKIVAYARHCSDLDADDDTGHGTHVAGSIAGHNGNDDPYGGVAHGAKLFVNDIDNSVSGYLACLPNDLYDDYLMPAHLYGARIHSSSWGGASSATYSISEIDIDAFAWRYPESISLFAAGNSGPGVRQKCQMRVHARIAFPQALSFDHS